MRRIWSSILGVIAVAAILIGINVLAERWLANVQIDLTSRHLYTLSAGTRSVVGGLKEPVTLRLYYSRALGSRIPAYGAYADRVSELLREYARIGNGRIRLEFHDPEPYSDTEERATAYGLQGVPVDQSGEQVYFGLAGTNLLDDERTITFFQPEREPFLEYDLTRLVFELSNPKRPVVGVMSSLPLDGDPRSMMMARNSAAMGGPGAPFVSMLQLRQSATVKAVATDAQVIDPDVQVLLVAQAHHDPAFNDLHCRFRLGLVLRMPWSCRQYRGAVVASKVEHGIIAAWFVAVGIRDHCLGVVGNDELRNAADETERGGR